MNFNKDLFEKAEAKEFGEFETLDLGGHELIILDAREYTSEISGNTSLKVSVDIGGTDKQAGFFKRQYDEAKKNKKDDKEEIKWPTGGVKYLSLKDEQLAYLKGFITAVENSNKGFKFDTNGTWEQLKGKKLAGVFGLEEYNKTDGSIASATKLIQFRSLDKLAEIKIPRVKLIDGSFVDYEEYKPSTSSNSKVDAIEIAEEMLPF